MNLLAFEGRIQFLESALCAFSMQDSIEFINLHQQNLSI